MAESTVLTKNDFADGEIETSRREPFYDGWFPPARWIYRFKITEARAAELEIEQGKIIRLIADGEPTRGLVTRFEPDGKGQVGMSVLECRHP
jgi:hypothetical protein